MFQRRKERARKEKWIAEKERIKALQDGLKGLGELPEDSKEVFLYAAKFFDVVSTFQDGGYVLYAPEKVKEESTLLNKHVTNAGRQPYGINRTKFGEVVTIENTYWGNIFGLFTFTGKEWSESSSIYYGFKSQWLMKDADYEENPLNRKVIADFQVDQFLNSHIHAMIQLCDVLLKA